MKEKRKKTKQINFKCSKQVPDTSDLQSDVLSLGVTIPLAMFFQRYIQCLSTTYLVSPGGTEVYPPITRCVAFDKTMPKNSTDVASIFGSMDLV